MLAATGATHAAISFTYVADADHAAIDVLTPLAVKAVEGAAVESLGQGRYRLRLHPGAGSAPGAYTRVEARVSLADEAAPAR